MLVFLPSVASFCGLCLLLITGKALRMRLSIIQTLYLPSSVVGGLVGLFLVQLAHLSPPLIEYIDETWMLGWNHIPGFLINIVFSSLFLGVEIPKASTVWHEAGPQLMYGMVLAWGQWVVALLVTMTFLVPVFGVPDLFATLIPVGFAGGHGTAAGLASSYTKLGWPNGGDFGLASATFGLVMSIILGVGWVNVAARRGWVVRSKMDKATDAKLSIRGVYPVDKRPIAGIQTVKADSIDTLALHVATVGVAMLIGYTIKVIFIEIEKTSESLTHIGALSGFPLFPLCMAGGIMIQLLLERFNKISKLVNAAVMERISGTALDFLITAAVASVNLQAVSTGIVPFLILCFTAILWHFFSLGFLAKLLLPNHWFERGICELGMSMGVIASGLVLLRMVDPESKSPVPADFAFKQLLHSPFMGGGIWTALAVPLTATIGGWGALFFCIAVLIGWLAVWFFYFRKTPPYQSAACQCKLCVSARRDPGPKDSLGAAEAGGSHTTPLVELAETESTFDGDQTGFEEIVLGSDTPAARDDGDYGIEDKDAADDPAMASGDDGEAGDDAQPSAEGVVGTEADGKSMIAADIAVGTVDVDADAQLSADAPSSGSSPQAKKRGRRNKSGGGYAALDSDDSA